MSSLRKDKGFFEHGAITERGLLAYINKEMSAEELQEAEQLLKEDPFAREALEGLQAATTTTPITTSLTSLNKKVRARAGMADKKPFEIHWANYAWAAALLGLLIGVGVVMINFVGKPSDELAQNKQEAPAPETQQPVLTEQAPALADSTGVSMAAPNANGTFMMMDSVSPSGKQPFTVSDMNTRKAEDMNQISPVMPSANSTLKTDAPPVAAPARKEKEPVSALVEDRDDKNLETVTNNFRAKESETAVYGYTTETGTQKVVRGSIVEKEEVAKVTLVTLDDAMKNFNSGNYKKSAEQFDAILQQQPNNADALYFGGVSDYLNGNDRKSEKSFDKLLREGSKFVDGSKWYKANLLLRKGKKEEALKLLNELSESNSSYKERAVKKKAEIKF